MSLLTTCLQFARFPRPPLIRQLKSAGRSLLALTHFEGPLLDRTTVHLYSLEFYWSILIIQIGQQCPYLSSFVMTVWFVYLSNMDMCSSVFLCSWRSFDVNFARLPIWLNLWHYRILKLPPKASLVQYCLRLKWFSEFFVLRSASDTCQRKSVEQEWPMTWPLGSGHTDCSLKYSRFVNLTTVAAFPDL
jgi:hypothetical protein